MEIEIHRADKVTIEEFADKNSLKMVVRERTTLDIQFRWYASFERAEVRTGTAGLLSEYGNGKTPEEAINDYAKEISGKLLIINAMSKDRKEIYVPYLSLN